MTHRRLRTRTFLLLSFLLSGCLPATERFTLVKQGDYDDLRRQVERLAQAQMREHATEGMSLSIVEGDRLVMESGFGMADKENRLEASPETLYQIGSITKLFTATAVMHLAERGKLSLDAPITTYLPDFSIRSRFPGASAITLRHVLSHHSGLPGNYLKGFFNPTPPRFTSLVPDLKPESLAFAPGTVFSYSNVGYSLMGAVIERVSGERYEDYVTRHLLRPLRMPTSGFEPRDRSLIAKPYRGGTFEAEPNLRDLPAGGLYSSAHEMTRFMKLALAKGQLTEASILKAKTFASMLEPQNQDVPLDFGTKIGLGWMLSLPRLSYAGPVAWHNGSTIHHHAAMILLPEKQLGVTVLTNSTGGQAASMKVAEESLKLLLQAKEGLAPPSEEPKPDAGAVTPRKPVNGRYATAMGIMEVDGERLELFGQGLQLFPRADGAYGVRVNLFGLIPLSLPQLSAFSLRFESVGNRDLLVMSQHGLPAAIGERLVPGPVPDVWKKRLGNYAVENAGEDFSVAKDFALVEEKGQLAFTSQSTLAPMPPIKLVLVPLSDHEAFLAGVGSGLGEVLRVEETPDGERLWMSGYRLAKQGN